MIDTDDVMSKALEVMSPLSQFMLAYCSTEAEMIALHTALRLLAERCAPVTHEGVHAQARAERTLREKLAR